MTDTRIPGLMQLPDFAALNQLAAEIISWLVIPVFREVSHPLWLNLRCLHDHGPKERHLQCTLFQYQEGRRVEQSDIDLWTPDSRWPTSSRMRSLNSRIVELPKGFQKKVDLIQAVASIIALQMLQHGAQAPKPAIMVSDKSDHDYVTRHTWWLRLIPPRYRLPQNGINPGIIYADY